MMAADVTPGHLEFTDNCINCKDFSIEIHSLLISYQNGAAVTEGALVLSTR